VAWRPRLLVGLAAIAVAVTGYLTWVHFSGSAALCAGAGGCETVQASRYATVLGLPVALFGLALDLTVLGLGLWRLWAGDATPYAAVLGLFGLCLAGALYSVYLVYLQLFVIGAICPWCMTSATLLFALCALSAWELWAFDSGGG
jgi:uncharacterized membrane protein